MSLELILDCGPLMGRSLKSAAEVQRFRGMFADKRSWTAYVDRARSLGYDSFWCTYEPKLLKAVGRQGALYAVVPDASRYVRDMNNYGLVRMGLRRAAEAGFGLASLLPTGLRNVPGLLAKDFGSILIILTELEMIRFKAYRPRAVFLHPQMTDLFLANGNPDPIRRFAAFVRRKYGLEPGLFSNNLVLLDRFLEDENLDIRRIAAPINPEGYLMKPDRGTVERLVARSDREILAYDITCGGTIDLERSLSYARGLGLEKATLELADLPPRGSLERASADD